MTSFLYEKGLYVLKVFKNLLFLPVFPKKGKRVKGLFPDRSRTGLADIVPTAIKIKKK